MRTERAKIKSDSAPGANDACFIFIKRYIKEASTVISNLVRNLQVIIDILRNRLVIPDVLRNRVRKHRDGV